MSLHVCRKCEQSKLLSILSLAENPSEAKNTSSANDIVLCH